MPTNVKVLLLDQLRAGGLLEPAQLEELARLPEAKDPDPRPLAKQVLQRGWLTRFQLALAAQGKAAELTVGPYALLDRLGEGGMGQVFKARHRHMSRVVALKLIRKEKLKSPEAVQRFYQEVQAAGQLHHPNIVLAYDAGQTGNTHYLSMEFVDGQDLARLVKEKGPLPIPQACDYIRQAALGLQHAHERGMVHRDVKPSNLLVAAAPAAERAARPWGVVKILDMGLARLQQGSDQEHGLTQTGAVIGTPDYLAPEQALNSRAADIRSDLYSLGCSLYYLLAGRPPFHAEALTQLLLKHQMEEPTPLEELRPDVPAGVADVVRALLAKRPEDRVQTPADLAAALGPFCGGTAGAVTRVPPPRAAGPEPENSWASLVSDATGPVTESLARPRTVAVEGGPAGRRMAKRGKAGASKLLLLGALGAGAFLLLGAVAVGVTLWALLPRPGVPTTPGPVVDVGNPPSVAPTVRTVREPTARERPPAPTARESPPTPEPHPDNPPPAAPQALPPAPGELRRLDPGDLPVARLAFSPDGRRVAGSDNIRAYVWDVESGRLLKRLGGPPVLVQAVAWCPDGRRLLLGGGGKVVQLWDAEEGKLLRDFPGHAAQVHGVATSPDGRRAFSAAGEIETQDGKPVRKDNRLVYKDCTVRAWDLETGRELYHFDGHAEAVTQVTLSADGRRALSRSRDALCLWDTDGGREIRRLAERNGLHYQVAAAVLCPDGRQAVLGTQTQGPLLWDVEADQEVRRFESYVGQLDGLALSADGRVALSSSHQFDTERKKFTDVAVRAWDVSSGRQLHRFDGHAEMVSGLALALDGRLAASSSWDKTARLWDLSAAVPVAGPTPPAPTKPPVVKKVAVPSKDEQAEAEKLVKKQEAEAKKPAERVELAHKFLDKARATNDDPAGRFVLLREARDLAAQAADSVTALQAADQLAQLYDLDAPLEMKQTALAAAAKAATTLPASKAVAEGALAVLDEAVAADDYKAAGDLLKLAEAAARKAPQGTLTRVEARAREVREAEKDHAACETARATLKDQPDDTDANLTVGKYLCIRKGDWDAGLPLLAKGSDQALQDLARADLARPAGAEAQVQVGDGWWKLAETTKPEAGKTQLQRRACHWYQQAVTGVTGLTQDRIEGRLKEVQEQVADLKAAETAGEGRLFLGHTAKVIGVAFLPDGKRVISGGADRVLRVWDVQTGKEVRAFEVPAALTCVAVAASGNSFGAGTTGGEFRIWDAEALKGTGVKSGNGTGNPVTGAAFAPDEHRIAIGTKSGLMIWEDNTGHGHTSGKWSAVTGMAANKAGNFVFLGFSDGAVRLWNVETSKEEREWIGHNGAVLGVALSKDGRYAVSCGADKTVHLWDVLTALEVRHFTGHTGQALAVAVSPDAHFVATGGEDHTVRLWDARTGRELRRFTGHAEAVTSLAFSADGHQLLSGSEDKTVRLWQLARPAGP